MAPLLTDARGTVWLPSAPARAAAQAAALAAQDPDALYARRADLTAARAAADIWSARLRAATPRANLEAAWKLARASYWLGGHEPTREARRAALERGMEAARAAIAAAPDRPEGHFWLAANMGALAESSGLMAGLKYRGAIRRELETVLRIDPAYQDGSADRALGRWYFRVPGLFGGSKKRSEEYLRRSLTYDPTSHASLFFLAETLHALGRDAEARAALENVILAPAHADWGPEDAEFKKKARAMLQEIKN